MARVTRIALDLALEASKTLRPALGNAWQYAKTELVPPLTLNFFNGPNGKRLEERVSKAADNFIAGIKKQIDDIEAEKLREIQRKEAAAKALAEKKKAEAKKKAEEAKKKAEEIAKKAKAAAEKKAQAATAASAKAKKDEKETVKTNKETKKSPEAVKKKQPAKSSEQKKKSPPKPKK
ncbi:tol-Pal system protein TolA-like [Vanessa cardui]|uniref:tol-Pal system protein TolA-like n=1 Tax=Vanessa cardui TaxID=171605 RepID=UPI001F13DA40|nr:tol-Pal system protein TolA-like [Vanessa cardui]